MVRFVDLDERAICKYLRIKGRIWFVDALRTWEPFALTIWLTNYAARVRHTAMVKETCVLFDQAPESLNRTAFKFSRE